MIRESKYYPEQTRKPGLLGLTTLLNVARNIIRKDFALLNGVRFLKLTETALTALHNKLFTRTPGDLPDMLLFVKKMV